MMKMWGKNRNVSVLFKDCQTIRRELEIDDVLAQRSASSGSRLWQLPMIGCCWNLGTIVSVQVPISRWAYLTWQAFKPLWRIRIISASCSMLLLEVASFRPGLSRKKTAETSDWSLRKAPQPSSSVHYSWFGWLWNNPTRIHNPRSRNRWSWYVAIKIHLCSPCQRSLVHQRAFFCLLWRGFSSSMTAWRSLLQGMWTGEIKSHVGWYSLVN